jgi:hypothetical protein
VASARDSGHLPDPGEYAKRARQVASTEAASVMSAHTAQQIIIVVEAAERSAAVALGIVSQALTGMVRSFP